jgi:lysophospholipase L1-like esterase
LTVRGSKKALFSFGLVCVTGLVLAFMFLVSEVVYRAYLYHKAQERFVRKLPGPLTVYGEPFWIYDEQFGYRYPNGEPVPTATIHEGRVVRCSELRIANRQGNIGEIIGDYDSADVRILVFGDSFTATSHDGTTWPNLLQRKLTDQLGCTVHVVNFARDGTGILQMFDIAAVKIQEWKPDLAIFAFITNDLQRIRFWRTVTKVDGLWRYLVSPFPTPNPDPLRSYDTALYHPEATREWCLQAHETGRHDRVIQEIQEAYQEGVSVGGTRTASILALNHSYLHAAIRHRDPFYGLPGFFAFPVITHKSYSEDDRFMRSLKSIEQSGVPYILMHLAFFPELKEGKEYILTTAEESLLQSLRTVTGKEVFETTKYLNLPLSDPERFVQSPDNYHPSLAGLNLYAEAIGELLAREKLVRPCNERSRDAAGK